MTPLHQSDRDLLRKYRNDSLTPDELTDLREKSASTDDDRLLDWLSSDADDRDTTITDADKRFERMKTRITASIGIDADTAHPRAHIMSGRARATVAAVIAVPILFIAAIYAGLVTVPAHTPVTYTEITTTGRQNTTLTLPDGSTIIARGDSHLRYASDFGEKNRDIVFSGEGHFDIAKDASLPFVVSMNDMEVTVTGTEFSINDRRMADIISIELTSGNVDLTSALTGQRITLDAGYTARLNKLDGRITVDTIPANLRADWRKSEVAYDNVTPEQLVASIEEYYDITLGRQITDRINANFTGTLPYDDLPTVLKVLNRVYGIQVPYMRRHTDTTD
ncbi:MAG: FecR domain-containing protein [Paramuribaculum sp.]|nr:FecR domain-containing protein [Paramuribaculum sp.]